MTIADLYGDVRFNAYYSLLVEWNAKFNLTSVTDKDDVFLKHFYDSVLPAPLIPDNATVLDIGSGAGFPGVCLKLVSPSLSITLLDSVGKKVTFLEEVIRQLQLTGIRAVKSRIEDFKERAFDVVTARAVAPARTLAEYCLPFVKINGFALFYKSEDIKEELSGAKHAIELLGGQIEKTVVLPLSKDINRSFVIVKKVRACPQIYPRAGNKPRTSPLE